MNYNAFDVKLVVEAARYLRADTSTRRFMIEACGDAYPEEHTGTDGRMMDYGHEKSDSHEGRMTKAKLFRLAQMAQRLHDKMVDDDDLPEWEPDSDFGYSWMGWFSKSPNDPTFEIVNVPPSRSSGFNLFSLVLLISLFDSSTISIKLRLSQFFKTRGYTSCSKFIFKLEIFSSTIFISLYPFD